MENPKTARSIILEAIEADPARTAAELAELAKCSRQRVHQIISAEGLKLSPPRAVFVAPQHRVATTGVTVRISNTAHGIAAELLAAADLTARGWHVFSPIVRTQKCDLIVLSADGERVRRIEVRSGKRGPDGKLKYPKRVGDICDHYAVVPVAEPIEFIPDIEAGK